MLNIGRLGTDLDGIVDYYITEVGDGADRSIPSVSPGGGPESVSSSTESYYLKNASGRWVGALRDTLGVDGAVEADAFRRLLEGCHPLTGEPLTRGATQALAKRMNRRRRSTRSAKDSTMSVKDAAQRLDMSERHVQRLLKRGGALDDEATDETWAYLRGVKTRTKTKNTGPGREIWQIPAAEVERFSADRETASMRPGFDLTLRPPKSVSILWALGRPAWSQIVAQAHREATDEVIAYYEANAIFSRKRVEGDQQRITTEGLIGAAFDHRTSRAGDPLLHTHIVTFNLTLCSDGTWRSLDGTPIYEHAKTGGYLYQAHLRHVLTRELGLAWTEVVNGCAEIEGIPTEVIDAFSKRREEIECAVAEAGYTSAAAHQAASLATRRPKGNEPEPPVAVERWWEEAKALGFSEQQLADCVFRAAGKDVGTERSCFADTLTEVFEELMDETGLTLMMSSFTERDVLRDLAERAIAACSAQEIRDHARRFAETAGAVRLNASGKESDLVLTADGTERAASLTRYSTPELLGKEADIIEWAANAFDGSGPVATAGAVEAALDLHLELSEEQIAMVRGLTRGANRLNIVAGDPGSGKTHAAKVAVEAFSASGVPVIGAALSADAGSELELSVDLMGRTGREAGTIAKLLDELDHPEFGGFQPGTALILDEASMVGTRMLHRLTEHLGLAKGSLILLGDPNQHGSVEAGGVYRHLTQTQKDHVLSLHANNRQTDEVERRAIAEFRDARIAEALGLYDRAGKIVRSKTLAESYEAMVKDWHETWNEGDRSPMLAGLNVMRQALNNLARAKLREAGELGEQKIVASEREYCVGDWVVARRNKRGLKSASRNHVKNGSIGTVISLDTERHAITVRFDAEGVIRLPDWYLDDGNLDHAYARTTYGVQGKTLGRGSYQPTDVSSFEEGYVALTRAKSGTRIYIVDDDRPENSKPSCSDYDERWELNDELITKALEKRRAKIMAREVGEAVRDQGIEVDR